MTWVNYLVNSYSNDLVKLLGKVNDGITVIQMTWLNYLVKLMMVSHSISISDLGKLLGKQLFK